MCNSLFLSLSDNTGQVEIDYAIPRQIIKIKNCRLQFDLAASAIANGVVFLDVPWLSSSQLVDNTGARYRIPLISDGNVISVVNLDIEVELSSDIEKRFSYTIYDSNGTIMSDAVLLNCQLQLEFCREERIREQHRH